jgi:CheY-like chemotaxis protein
MPHRVLLVIDPDKFDPLRLGRFLGARGLDPEAADYRDPIRGAKKEWTKAPLPIAAVVDLAAPVNDRPMGPKAGWELVRWMKAQRPDALIAVLSRSVSDADRQLGQELGVSVFLRRKTEIEPSLDPFFDQAVSAAGPPPPPDPRQLQLNEDYRWATEDPEVQRRHGGQVVAVYQHEVWGAGRSHTEAFLAARERPGCPDRSRLAYAVIPDAEAELDDPEVGWCLNDPEAQRRYGGLVVAVSGGKIWGAGYDREDAWRVAQRKPDCPAPGQLRYVVIPVTDPDTISP